MVVLGDLGRSPRMQYHALALADAGARVDLIGLGGSEPFAALREHPAIRIRQLPDPPPPLAASGARYLAGAARRATAQARALQRALEAVAAPVILAQTPPAVPTLVVALRAARRRRARLVIDWHNLGHALLALRLGAGHPAVHLTALAEQRFGRAADAHLCVSEAMRAALRERWGIDAVVLPDRPARPFAPLADAARDDAARGAWRRATVGMAAARARRSSSPPAAGRRTTTSPSCSTRSRAPRRGWRRCPRSPACCCCSPATARAATRSPPAWPRCR